MGKFTQIMFFTGDELLAHVREIKRQVAAIKGEFDHTSGPWIVDEAFEGDQYRNVLQASDARFSPAICRVYVGGGQMQRQRKEAEANAQLIAMAPDMYYALTAIAYGSHDPQAVKFAKRALGLDAE